MGVIRTLMVTALILAAMIIVVVFMVNQQSLTGQTVIEDTSNKYTHTKAICNETEKGTVYCEDYEITCKGNETVSSIATGFSVFHDENWEDPRGENASDNLCG